MRLRNYKEAKDIINNSKYIIENPERYKGKYKELFNNDNKLNIEIGMGKGNFIINNALKYPDINFIGIEKFDSVIARAIDKIEDKNIPNLKLIRMDATEINDVFCNEIDTIYLNFSDPWPKKRHSKRRLTHTEFLKKYDKVFKERNNIIIKTDNRKLFEFSITELINYGYKINDISLDLYSDDVKDNIPTEYETKFSNKGCIIYMISVTK